jgi:23S rRNA pseudouridine1911/1915/1917 synthase
LKKNSLLSNKHFSSEEFFNKEMPGEGKNFSLTIGMNDLGSRLDCVVTAHLNGCSRSRVNTLIRNGCILVNDCPKKSSYCMKPGDCIKGHIPLPESTILQAEPIDIHILFEDQDIIVVNKKAGMVVHPAPGHMTGTMANALLYHCPDIEGTGSEARPGIVHRLDKDTSGVIVVAKNSNAHIKLCRQFEQRTIHKEYFTLVYGNVKPESGRIELPIGRHPTDRTKMAVVQGNKGRHALTLWQVEKRFEGVTLLAVILKTGRTHQIRVHCASMHHPIVGDMTYSSSKVFRNFKNTPPLLHSLQSVERQMLHAHRITLKHPVSGKTMSFEAPFPKDMNVLLENLQNTVAVSKTAFL